MSEADYSLDKRIYDAYFGIPIANDPANGWIIRPTRSLRKLGVMFGCSHENIRIRLDRYIVMNEHTDIYTKLPMNIGGLLINKEFNKAEKIIKATDEDLLSVKGIGLRRLKVIREAFPYNPDASDVDNVPIENEEAVMYIKREFSKRWYWKNSKQWKRKKRK